MSGGETQCREQRVRDSVVSKLLRSICVSGTVSWTSSCVCSLPYNESLISSLPSVLNQFLFFNCQDPIKPIHTLAPVRTLPEYSVLCETCTLFEASNKEPKRQLCFHHFIEWSLWLCISTVLTGSKISRTTWRCRQDLCKLDWGHLRTLVVGRQDPRILLYLDRKRTGREDQRRGETDWLHEIQRTQKASILGEMYNF